MTISLVLSLPLSLISLTIHDASAQVNNPSCLGLNLAGQTFGDVDDRESCKDACKFFGTDGFEGANGTGASYYQWSYDWATTNGAKEASCSCGSNLDLLCKDEIATSDPTPGTPTGDPKQCSKEGISSGNACQAACTTLGFSSYASETLNGIWECSCGDMGVFCKDTISPDFTTEPKSCTDNWISSFTECSRYCGADGSSWDTFTSSDGVIRTCCVCINCGVYCTDSDETCVSSAGTCTAPLGGGGGDGGTVDSGGKDDTAQSCAARQISSFVQCSSACDAIGSSGPAWWSSSRSPDTEVNVTCCVCSSCGVYCTDSDPSCMSSAGFCQDDGNGGGGVVPASEPPVSAPVLPTSAPMLSTSSPQTKEPVSKDEDKQYDGLVDGPTSSGTTVATGWCFVTVMVMRALV